MPLRLRIWALAASAFIAVPMALSASAVEAAPAAQELAPFGGSYKYVGGPAQKKKIAASIEAATDDMFPGIRGIARSRLADSNPAVARIELAVEGGFVKINHVGFRSVTAPASGMRIPWKNRHGDKTKASHKLEGGKLVQRLVAEEGTRQTTYSLSADGKTLTVKTKITSRRLDSDVSYRLTYKRVG